MAEHRRKLARFEIRLPEGVQETLEGRVSTFRKPESALLLRTSSFKRNGPQVPARDRLRERLELSPLMEREDADLFPRGCPDWAATKGVDATGALWIHVYAVWPGIVVYITLSCANEAELRSQGGWALEAVRSIVPLDRPLDDPPEGEFWEEPR